MSGGSYGYLHIKADGGLFADAIDHTHLAEMVERLEGLPWAADIGRDARSIIKRAAALDADLRCLSAVFHAIEWWDSSDWGEDQVREALDAYRKSG